MMARPLAEAVSTPGTSSTNVAAVRANAPDASKPVIWPVAGSTSPARVNEPVRSSATAAHQARLVALGPLLGERQ